jgi:hypothetical protein
MRGDTLRGFRAEFTLHPRLRPRTEGVVKVIKAILLCIRVLLPFLQHRGTGEVCQKQNRPTPDDQKICWFPRHAVTMWQLRTNALSLVNRA